MITGSAIIILGCMGARNPANPDASCPHPAPCPACKEIPFAGATPALPHHPSSSHHPPLPIYLHSQHFQSHHHSKDLYHSPGYTDYSLPLPTVQYGRSASLLFGSRQSSRRIDFSDSVFPPSAQPDTAGKCKCATRRFLLQYHPANSTQLAISSSHLPTAIVLYRVFIRLLQRAPGRKFTLRFRSNTNYHLQSVRLHLLSDSFPIC